MDLDIRNPNNMYKRSQPSHVVEGESVGKKEEEKEEEEEEESNSLLASAGANGRGGMTEWQKSTRRKVQWNDSNGNKLVEVLEFQPSDTSDSDEDDYVDSCICTIM